MDRRPSAYTVGVSLAAAGLVAGNWLRWGVPTVADPGLLLLLVALAITAQQFPFVLGPQHKANAAIGCYFAVLLLFGSSTALALTALSQLLGGLLLQLRLERRTGNPWRGTADVVFETAQYLLAIGLAGLVAHAGLPIAQFTPNGLSMRGWAIPLAAVVAILVSSWLGAVRVGLRQGRPPFQVWRRGQPDAMIETASILGLGVVTATVAVGSPWMVLLLALLGALLQRALQRSEMLLAEQAATAGRLEHQAFHDPLTGLPNRAYVHDRLTRVGSGGGTTRFAVLYVDLDNFKIMNDSLGHAAGDQILLAMARRLRAAVQPPDVVARLGGDEFLVFLDETPAMVPASLVAERLAAAVEAPLLVDDQELHVAASIGIAHCDPGVPPEEWLRQADIAMHEAKASGKTRHVVADAAMASRAKHRLTLEQELRRALEVGELAVYYQPKVALATGRVAGWEALVRWRHPQRGVISPAAFIPLAEETGLILPLGEWVLREACCQVVRWQRAWSTPLAMSVNLSVRQVRQAALVERIGGILSETEIGPDCLELELTESMAMEDPERSIAVLGRLQQLGVRLALDDFGSGYSSLRSMQRLPLDAIKIDRSLVADLGRDQRTWGILQAVVTLGHTLGLAVVAEGVESVAQLAPLRALGCDFAQGYHFGRPMDAASATALLASRLAPGTAGSVAG